MPISMAPAIFSAYLVVLLEATRQKLCKPVRILRDLPPLKILSCSLSRLPNRAEDEEMKRGGARGLSARATEAAETASSGPLLSLPEQRRSTKEGEIFLSSLIYFDGYMGSIRSLRFPYTELQWPFTMQLKSRLLLTFSV
ncbi:uncharacterized protein LOC109828496 [Asparagus officinalis]|uniref:uncharacterized protein LOC109828496 n=1 Tax=Asparagus officinalis TaxID=4686 RepID=UPI00098E7DC8|nr:uncharacterized protein LOC109828496 [Asparagus officinalis]